MFTELFTELPGQTLFAFPEGASFPLSGWLANRVAVTEPLSGLYSATLDDSIADNWLVFVGSAQPANHFAAIYRISKPQTFSGSSLSGANVVTITVQLNSQPVQGAKVRLARVGESEVKETNASGQVVFSANDGNWTVSITKPGLSFTPISLTVDGTENVTYSMVEIAPPPPSTLPNAATGFLDCFDANNVLQSGVQINVQMIAGPGVSGYSFDSPIRSATSGANGRVVFTDLIRGATYQIWRGFTGHSQRAKTFVVPDSVANFALPEVL